MKSTRVDEFRALGVHLGREAQREDIALGGRAHTSPRSAQPRLPSGSSAGAGARKATNIIAAGS
jgi:hypothetical protein